MAGLNRVDIIGNLGADPETRYAANGNAITNISLATSEKWKDAQGQEQEKTEWHRVVLFGKVAEIAAKYLKKGSECYVCGKLQTRKWQDQQGQDRYTTEIVVDGFDGRRLQLMGKPPQNDNGQAPAQQQRQSPPSQQREGYRSSGSAAPNNYQPNQQPAQQAPGSYGDDIPF